jgi:hypothetical protein
MEVSEQAVGAMQAYLRLKRYILPSGIAREALEAAAPFLSALEPSAARELALEEAARNAAMYLATGFITCPRCGEDVETKNTDAEYALRAALSSPDHADAGKVVEVKLPTERVCIPDPHNPDARIVGFRIREGDDAWGETGLSEPISWLNKLLTPSAGKVEGDALPQDVINLVIAAREAFDTGVIPEDEEYNLDKALEPFSERVRYENEPASEGAE